MYRDEVTLWDIWKASHNILDFIKDMDQKKFYSDNLIQSAVLHQFMIMGEAVKRISPEYRNDHPEIPWKDIAGMRDKLIHFYEGVDLELVWITTSEHIPALITKLEPLVPKLPEE